MDRCKWILRGDVVILKESENELKLIAEKEVYRVRLNNKKVIEQLHELRTTGLEIDFSNVNTESFIRKLKDASLIHIAPPCELSQLQATQWLWNEAIAPNQDLFQRLRNLSIVIVGCGGTGSLVAQSLAGSGVGSFTLIDFDRVSIGNLNRQFVFNSQDVGKYKANVLAERLIESQQVIEAKPFISEITSSKQLSMLANGSDLIICCADEPKGAIQNYIANAALKVGASALYGAVGIWSGTIGPLLIDKSSFKAYLKWIKEVEFICDKTIIPARFPSNGSTNAVIANLIALEALFYLAKLGPSRIEACSLKLNFNSLEFFKMQEFR